MADVFPDLSRFDRVGCDTETTSEDDIRRRRPVGFSYKLPTGVKGYIRWGHPSGNNCTLAEFTEWVNDPVRGLARPSLLKVFFNLPYDLRMLVYAGVITWPRLLPNCADAGTSAALLNENEPSYSLDRLAEKYLGRKKNDGYLNEWLAAQFGGKPWHSAQAKNIHKAPGDLVEPYAADDADLTLDLHDRNMPLILADDLGPIYDLETAVIPVVVNMNLAGTRIDRARAESVVKGLGAELGRAKTRWAELAEAAGFPMPHNSEWVVPSTPQVAPVFRALGVPAIGETEAGNDSVTKEMLEAVADLHPAARVLLDVRELSKLAGTFVQSYILDQADDDDLVHGEFHPLPVEYLPGKRYGTVSGRLASSLHNVPGDRHPAPGRLIRSMFVPWTPGHEWVKADYSQIEYRFLGHYAQGSIAAAYNSPQPPGLCLACGKDHAVVGADFHCMLTLLIGGGVVDPNCNRRRTKNVDFAKVYGAGLKKAAATAGISVDAWRKIVAIYDERVPEVADIYGAADKRANSRGYIVTWGGRRIRFMSAADAKAKGWKVHHGERYLKTYKALNNLLQGSAADLMKKAMVRVASLVDWSDTFLHLSVHDELDFSVPRGDARDKFVARLREAMEDWSEADGPLLNVPIKADIKAGESWGALIKEDPDEEAPSAALAAAVAIAEQAAGKSLNVGTGTGDGEGNKDGDRIPGAYGQRGGRIV